MTNGKSLSIEEKVMRFKKSPQPPGGGKTRAWHHHGSDMPTSPGAILLHSSLMGGIEI